MSELSGGVLFFCRIELLLSMSSRILFTFQWIELLFSMSAGYILFGRSERLLRCTFVQSFCKSPCSILPTIDSISLDPDPDQSQTLFSDTQAIVQKGLTVQITIML